MRFLTRKYLIAGALSVGTVGSLVDRKSVV